MTILHTCHMRIQTATTNHHGNQLGQSLCVFIRHFCPTYFRNNFFQVQPCNHEVHAFWDSATHQRFQPQRWIMSWYIFETDNRKKWPSQSGWHSCNWQIPAFGLWNTGIFWRTIIITSSTDGATSREKMIFDLQKQKYLGQWTCDSCGGALDWSSSHAILKLSYFLPKNEITSNAAVFVCIDHQVSILFLFFKCPCHCVIFQGPALSVRSIQGTPTR